MTLLEARNAIVGGIRALIPALKTCEGHGGRFDVNEVRRIAARAPGVFVACLGAAGADETTGDVESTLQWVAFVVTKDQPNAPRDAAALAIVHAMLVGIPGNRWGLDAGRPKRLAAANLYSATLDGMGVAMWSVAWQQSMNLGGAVDPAELAAFATFDAVYDLDQPTGSGEPEANDHLTGLDQA